MGVTIYPFTEVIKFPVFHFIVQYVINISVIIPSCLFQMSDSYHNTTGFLFILKVFLQLISSISFLKQSL